MSGKDGQGKPMQCRASWSKRLAWTVVIASGILGAAIAEGAVVASPDLRSRHVNTDPARSNPLHSHQEDAIHPSQCTANFDYPGEANPADLEITSASHRALLTAEGKPAHKLSSVLQHMIPHKSFLEVPVPYASPQVAPTSNPSIPSPSAGLQVASPYALPSTPLFSPSSSQPTISPATPAPTPASTSVQMPTPSPQSLPLPSITAVPVTTLSPTPGITSTPAGSAAASPTTLTASPAASASPVTVGPVVSPSTASPSPPSVPNGPAVPSSTPPAASSPGTSDITLPTAPGPPSSPAATATSTLTASPATTIPAVSSPGATSSGVSSPGASSSGASSPGASSPGASSPGASSSGASSSAPPSQLQFIPIPFGFEPLVTAQATFLAIPATSLTLLQVAEVAADLQQALANVTNGSIPVTAVVIPINAAAAAPAPLPSRRHLLQTGNTLQATVLFTATFATAPGSNTAVSTAVQAAVATAVAPLTVTTSATSIGSGSYNVTIVFPANNQVSSSASQGTFAATTFLAGLKSSPTNQLGSLAASQGSFTVSASQIQDNLVTLSPGSVSPAAAASPVLTSPSPASEITPAATSPTAAATITPSPPADAAPVAETTPTAASTPVPTSTAGATTAPATPTPTEATPAASQLPPPVSPSQTPPSDAGQASPPSPPPTSFTPSTPEPTSEALAPTAESPSASPFPTPDPAEAAPQATPSSPLLAMNLSVAFPPTATAAAQDLASMLFNQSQRDFYAVIAKNGPIIFSNVLYGSQLIPLPSIAPAPAPAPGPDTMMSSAAAAAAAPESASSSGAAIESYSGPDADDSSLAASGQLYAINMQYGVGGARTNAVANLLVLSSNSSGPPSATDFAVQLGNPAQTGNVSVLSTYSSSSDYLIRVDCPEGYTGPVTVGYASPVIQAVNYNVIDSALLVKVTASTATQQ